MCKGPVGDGAKRTLTGFSDIFFEFFAKIVKQLGKKEINSALLIADN